MSQNNTIALYKWILQEFTVEGRADFVNYLGPHLAALVHRDDRVLDLCCGAGSFSFFLEEQGAKVTAIDFAPYMIQLAHEVALKRRSAVDFIQADVLTHDLGIERFDLVVFLGNTVSDFPLNRFIQLGQKVGKALKQGGDLRFTISTDSISSYRRNIQERAFSKKSRKESLAASKSTCPRRRHISKFT